MPIELEAVISHPILHSDVCEHLDQNWSIRYGPHAVGRYNAQEWPCLPETKRNGRGKTVEKTLRGKSFGLSHLAWKSGPNRGIPTFHSHGGCALSTSNRTDRVL